MATTEAGPNSLADLKVTANGTSVLERWFHIYSGIFHRRLAPRCDPPSDGVSDEADEHRRTKCPGHKSEGDHVGAGANTTTHHGCPDRDEDKYDGLEPVLGLPSMCE